MDTRRLEKRIIKEAISYGNYEITGVLDTGEVIVAILSNIDKKVFEDLELEKDDTRKEKKINEFIKMKGRPAKEILQVYQQKFSNCKRIKKNNLIIR